MTDSIVTLNLIARNSSSSTIVVSVVASLAKCGNFFGCTFDSQAELDAVGLLVKAHVNSPLKDLSHLATLAIGVLYKNENRPEAAMAEKLLDWSRLEYFQRHFEAIIGFVDFLMGRTDASEGARFCIDHELKISSLNNALPEWAKGNIRTYCVADGLFELTFTVEQDLRAELSFNGDKGLNLVNSLWSDVPSYSPPYAMFLAMSKLTCAITWYQCQKEKDTEIVYIPGELQDFLNAQQWSG